MTDRAILTIETLGYWRCGTGKTTGADLDDVCARDPLGLPYIPGKHLRGLLRDGLRRVDETAAQALFGERAFDKETQTSRPKTTPGLLRIDSAYVDTALRDWLAQQPEAARKDLLATLFTHLDTVAIERDSGVAANQALRRTEAAVPMTLTAEILWAPDPYADPITGDWAAAWIDHLKSALPFVRAVGSDRSRGLGRCLVTLK